MKTRSLALLAACVRLVVLVPAGASSAETQQTCPDLNHPTTQEEE